MLWKPFSGILGPVRIGRAGKLIALAVALAAIAPGAAGAYAQPEEPLAGERIIAGEVADPAAWPSIAALYFEPPGSRGREFLICGGTVIAPRHVLTAAHCVEGARASRLALVVGRPDLRDKSAGQRLDVRSVQVDPAYSPPFFRGDFAVLELSADAIVAPAVLPNPAQDEAATPVGAPVRVAGWGGTKPSGGATSKVLLTASESVVEDRSCKRFYRRGFDVRRQICVRGDKVAGGINGACYGDSGGPLMADTPEGPLLVGVVSGGGIRCATQPEYYARVSASLGFIRRAAGVVPATP